MKSTSLELKIIRWERTYKLLIYLQSTESSIGENGFSEAIKQGNKV
jgi:hypothetical protein